MFVTAVTTREISVANEEEEPTKAIKLHPSTIINILSNILGAQRSRKDWGEGIKSR